MDAELNMDQLVEFYENNRSVVQVAGCAAVVAAGICLYRRLVQHRHARQHQRRSVPKDTVLLHQIGRGPYAPSMTPFAVKLETYLRMAKIPYQNDHSKRQASSKGKFPWMEYNGQSIADSAFCIAYLNQARGLDLHARLTPEQRAAALAFQRLVEDSLYWAVVLQKWVHELDVDFIMKSRSLPLAPLYIRYVITPMIQRYAWGHGMGRHSREEVLDIARTDLKAIADFMGQKKFLMGNEPCETDCAVFGMLSQLNWHAPTQTIGKMFREQFPSLVAYCERMKTTFWPDWDECITHGGTREATK